MLYTNFGCSSMGNQTEYLVSILMESSQWRTYEVWDTVIGLIVSLFTISLFALIRHQVISQKKIESARLLYEIAKNIDKSNINTKLIQLNENPEQFTFDDNKDLCIFLDYFEELAIFWKDGVINDFQISEWFSSALINMRRCGQIMTYLENSIRQPNQTYDRLHELIIKIAKEKNVVISTTMTTSTPI